MIEQREIRHFHLFCGLGGGAKGFNRASPRVGNMHGRFRCLGGVDVDPAAIADFSKAAGVPGTVLDMFDREQFRAFHGVEPPPGWQECGPEAIRRAASNERPHVVFLSAPCKGFSGLLSEGKSRSDKYQALNRLTVRGVWLMLEAWADDPPELIAFENVPRIATRGRFLLDHIKDLLSAYGYAVAETTHDCGQLGGLAQSRKRFLMAARHIEKVPPFLYEPPQRPLQAVGSVLSRMPLPGDPAGGPMHRMPRLAWKTWVRLAFVEAGKDWRSLNRLEVEDGVLRDYLIVPEYRAGYMGVNEWDKHVGTVAGQSLPTNGAFSIADPRFSQSALWNDGHAYGVRAWNDHSSTITSKLAAGSGYGSVADPRPPNRPLFSKYAVTRFDSNAGTVIGGDDSGAYAVADPRLEGIRHNNIFRVVNFDRPACAITGGTGPTAGAQCVADPRPGMRREKGDHYLTGGHYGVVPWTDPSGAVSASAGHDNGRWSVADPRIDSLPGADDKLVAVIRALDDTWHRPFTTLELAALQSLVDPEEQLILDGLSDQAWRERIGNAVPPDAAEAIGNEIGRTLLLTWAGETFQLSAAPIWVRNLAIALSVRQEAP